jgi:hypothetical protein
MLGHPGEERTHGETPPRATLGTWRKQAMKRFILTSILALTAMVLGQQRTSAWCELKMSGCHSCSFTCSGHCWYIGCKSDPYPGPTCAVPYGAAAGSYYQMYGAPPASGASAPTTPSTPPVGPPPTPVQKSGTEGWNNPAYQSAGYYSYPEASYSFYQAPSYWYGR